MSKKNIEVKFSYFPAFNILNDRGIAAAITAGKLQITPEITEDQLQPASLDIRIGEVFVYDDEVRSAYLKKPNSSNNAKTLKEIEELNYKDAKHFPDIKDMPICIPPRSFVEVHFHEKLTFDRQLFGITYELRSSRGRPALHPVSIMPYFERNEYFIGVHNLNPNPIILYGQDKFANILFDTRDLTMPHGEVITDPDLVAKHFPEFDKEKLITDEGYLVFKLGKEAKTFKKNITIDTRKSSEEYYQTHNLSKGYLLGINDPAIVELSPKVNLPANIGIRLLHRPPFHSSMQKDVNSLLQIIDFHQLNAGWVDPGYEGSLTAHPVRSITSQILQEGNLFCFGQVYLFGSDSARVYGYSALNSHYQHTTGATVSKS